MKLGGDVVLRVVVEANGSIGRIEVVTGASFGMTEAAMDAVRRWTYRPARVDGQPRRRLEGDPRQVHAASRARAASRLTRRTYNRGPLMPLMELVYEVEGQTRRYLLSGDDVSIGRSSENGIVLNDFSVSRRHALLSERGGTWTVEDLKSTNGLKVNGEFAPKSEIRPGDVLTVGTFTLTVREQPTYRGRSVATRSAIRAPRS